MVLRHWHGKMPALLLWWLPWQQQQVPHRRRMYRNVCEQAKTFRCNNTQNWNFLQITKALLQMPEMFRSHNYIFFAQWKCMKMFHWFISIFSQFCVCCIKQLTLAMIPCKWRKATQKPPLTTTITTAINLRNQKAGNIWSTGMTTAVARATNTRWSQQKAASLL